jgi:hypothetical protein
MHILELAPPSLRCAVIMDSWTPPHYLKQPRHDFSKVQALHAVHLASHSDTPHEGLTNIYKNSERGVMLNFSLHKLTQLVLRLDLLPAFTIHDVYRLVRPCYPNISIMTLPPSTA